MKKFLSLFALLGAMTLMAIEFPFTANFTDKTTLAPIRTSGDVVNNTIESGARYYFAALPLPASTKSLAFKLTVATRDGGSLGIIMFDDGVKNVLARPVWGRSCKGAETVEFVIPADKLKAPSKLYFYNVPRKGSVVISALQVATTDQVSAAPAPAKKGAPVIVLPYTSDFSKPLPAAVKLWGSKTASGSYSFVNKYSFGQINIPASKEPLSISLILTAEDGATFGAFVYELNANGTPGKRVAILANGKTLGQPKENVALAIPASTVPTCIYFYNNAKKGTLILDSICLEVME